MSEYFSTSPIVLVTGATDGIGYATARRFVDEGATVYLHAPDYGSGEKAMKRLVKDGTTIRWATAATKTALSPSRRRPWLRMHAPVTAWRS